MRESARSGEKKERERQKKVVVSTEEEKEGEAEKIWSLCACTHVQE